MFMQRSLIFLLLSIILTWGISVSAADSNSPIYQMAEIMHRLKHYPSPAGKDVLKKILSNRSTSENEKVIAMAILNLEHSVASSDKAGLNKILKSNSSQQEQDFASIILKLDHRPSAADKAKLKAMM